MFPNITREVVGWAIILGIVLGIFIDVYNTPSVTVVYASEEPQEPREVKLEVIIDWTPQRIEQEIREVFWEDPEVAVAIAKCESGLRATVQSHHTWRGERERSFGIFQVHQDSWHNKALSLGLRNYQSDVKENLAMARYIYDNAGKSWRDWSCYTKRMI